MRKSKLDGRRSIKTQGSVEGDRVQIIEFEPILIGDHFVTQQIVEREEGTKRESVLITKRDDGEILDQLVLEDFEASRYLEDLTNRLARDSADTENQLELLSKEGTLAVVKIPKEESRVPSV